MQTEKPKNRSILKTIFFYWLGYVFISTIITFLARQDGYVRDDLPVKTAITSIIILLIIGGLIALFRHRNKLRDKFSGLSLLTRRFVWATLCWFTLILTFVLVFSPFGRYMNDADWALTWKIILCPPLFIALGYFSYMKMIKANDNDQS